MVHLAWLWLRHQPQSAPAAMTEMTQSGCLARVVAGRAQARARTPSSPYYRDFRVRELSLAPRNNERGGGPYPEPAYLAQSSTTYDFD
jgi:hypothetical protein